MTAVTLKPDTVLAIDLDVDDTDDLSQVDQPLIDVPFAGHQSAYLEPDIPETMRIQGAGAGYEVTVKIDMRDDLTGYAVCFGNDDAALGLVDFGITMNGTGVFALEVNGTMHDVPGYTVSSTLFDAIVSFNGRPNPFTTGASDAIVCDVYIWDNDASEMSVRQIFHPEIVHTSGHRYCTGARSVDSATDYNANGWGPNRYPDSVRIGHCAKSVAQIMDDYSLRTAPTSGDATNFTPAQALPDSGNRLTTDDGVAGPVYQMAGENVKHAGRRGVGHIVHAQSLSGGSWQGSLYALDTHPSTSSQTLECQGTPELTDGPSGPSEPAFRMDSGGFLDSGSVWSSALASDYSVSFWVRVPILPGAGKTVPVCGFFEDTGAPPSNAFGEIRIDENGALQYRNQSGTAGSATSHVATSSSSLITADTWQHVAITIDETHGTEDVTFWVDGVEDSTVKIGSPENFGSSPFCLGGSYDGTSFANAALDIASIQYHAWAISDAMIEYEAGQGQGVLWRPAGTATASVRYWPMNENLDGFTPQKAFMPYTETEGTVHLSLGHSYKRGVSKKASHCRVMIRYATRDALGGAYDDDQHFRVYSQNAAPGKLYWPPVTIETHSVVTGNLASAPSGDIVTLDGLKIARNENDETWITVGIHSGDNTSQVRILSVEVIPYSKETDSDNPMVLEFP